jgi:hypothetical protein
MVEVSQHFEESTDFGRLKTYAWMPAASTSDIRSGGRDIDVDGAVRKAVDKYMAADGFTQAQTNPDVLVKYHLGLRETAYVTNFGMHYHEKVGWSETETVEDGQLTVDLVDAKTEQVIWRGTAWGALNVDPNQTIVNKNTDRAVKKIFEQYPPRGAKPTTGGY